MNNIQWQDHVQACNKSRQTKSAYAKKHKLPYHQLLYWMRKLNPDAPDEFIAVNVKPEIKKIDSLGVIEFPNGARLVIQSPELLALLPQLLTR